MLSGFRCGSAGKESACNVGDLGAIPRLGRSPGEGQGYPLQYSGLENPMDCVVHGVAKKWDTTERLSLSLSYLLYNVVLVSAIQQSESTINVSIHGLPWWLKG